MRGRLMTLLPDEEQLRDERLGVEIHLLRVTLSPVGAMGGFGGVVLLVVCCWFGVVVLFVFHSSVLRI